MENYEQKYKKALERARLLGTKKKPIDPTRSICEQIFPELKESKDEQHRKWILEYLYDGLRKSDEQFKDQFKSAIAWLEKQGEKSIPEDINEAALQYVDTCAVDGEITHDNITEPYWNHHSMMDAYKAGWLEKQSEHTCDCKHVGCHVNDMKRWCHKKQSEIPYEKCNTKCSEYLKDDEQKPADKVEPKFKVGDWITLVDGIALEKVVEFDGNKVRLIDTDGVYMSCPQSWLNDYHLWTIQDARDGDVLINNNDIFLFDGTLEEKLFPFAYCGIIDREFRIYDRKLPFTHSTYSYPATKEQSDLLFQKMKEAGYEWDAEKKELKKIEQKPSWSEEDLRNIEDIDSILFYDRRLTEDIRTRLRNFLKSLKPNHWKPSEEQMIALHHAISGCSYDIESLVELETKLKEF